MSIYALVDFTTWTKEDIVRWQFFQERLCMEFGIFHAAVEHILGGAILTHMFVTCQTKLEGAMLDKLTPMDLAEFATKIPSNINKLIFDEH